MLVNNEYPKAYQLLKTYDNGTKEYLVNIRENKYKKKEINLDDSLIDDDEDFPTDLDFCCENEEDKKEDDKKVLSRNEFYMMELKEELYQIYRQIIDLSSSLTVDKEVVENGDKAR